MLHLAHGQNWVDLVLVAYAVLVMPALSVFNGRRMARDPDASLLARYWRTMIRGWLTAAMVIVTWVEFHRDFAAIGLDVPVNLYGRIGLALVAAGLLFNGYMLLNLSRFVSAERYPKLLEQMRAMKILPRSTPEMLTFLLVSVTAGTWEELLYRGYMIWFVTPYGGIAFALLFSSAIFGLGHAYQGWRGVVRTGVLGLVFALAYVATQSLWWVMAAHALVDLYGGTLAWRLLRISPPEARAT